MIYCYDNAISKDLSQAISEGSGMNDIVKVIDAEGIMQLVAQIKEDQITFPLICLVRHPETPLDTERSNFTRIHRGVVTVYDPAKHNLYYERAIPIKLEYDLTILTTNTVDMDELLREVMFRYTSTYFLNLEVPYEGNRQIRFGVTISGDATRSSSTKEYLASGTLYQTIVPLRCEGAVLLHYTPKHIERTAYKFDQVEIEDPSEP